MPLSASPRPSTNIPSTCSPESNRSRRSVSRRQQMTSVVTLKRETYRSGQAGAIGDILRLTQNRMRSAHATHLGYPYNLVGYSPVPASFGDYLVNNLGDPYVGSHYGSHTCDLEREAVAWLMDLWRRPRSLLGLGRRERHRGQHLGALPGARGFSRRQAALQPRGALLDPQGGAHPAHGRHRGRLRQKRRHRHRVLRQGARCARRKSGDRGADLRHHGQGRA